MVQIIRAVEQDTNNKDRIFDKLKDVYQLANFNSYNYQNLYFIHKIKFNRYNFQD